MQDDYRDDYRERAWTRDERYYPEEEPRRGLPWRKILIGLGATELSMNVNSISRVRRTISHIAYEEAKEIADKLEICPTANDVEDYVRESFLKKWSHLFSPDILPPKKPKKNIKSNKLKFY